MRKLFVLSILLCASFVSFGQFGKLEPLGSIDSIYVLRTPRATLDTLIRSADKKNKNKGEFIEIVERMLESGRQNFLTNRISILDVQLLLKSIKYLQNQGVDVNYYVQEYFIYNPRKNSRN